MECFALFKTAEFLGKKAACLLTVVDANYTKENLTSKQREEDLDDMIEIALESVVSIDKIKDELADKLEDENPSSQYDVQEKARRILSWDMIDDERFEPIKDWAYKNGKDFDQILRLGSIPLRDYYFEKHPEIVNLNEKY